MNLNSKYRVRWVVGRRGVASRNRSNAQCTDRRSAAFKLQGYRLSPESNCSNINYNRRAIRMFERSGFEQVRAGTGGPVPQCGTRPTSRTALTLPLRLEPRLLRGPRLAHDTRHPAGPDPKDGPTRWDRTRRRPRWRSRRRPHRAARGLRYPLAGAGAPGAGGRVPSPCSTVPRESKNPLALPIPTTTH